MNPSETTWAAKLAKLRATLGREPNLNEMLELARTHRLTAEEIAAQAKSWAGDEMGMGLDAHEQAFREAVASGNRAEIERLEAEARVRMAMVR
jgi:hypothetical protein